MVFGEDDVRPLLIELDEVHPARARGGLAVGIERQTHEHEVGIAGAQPGELGV